AFFISVLPAQAQFTITTSSLPNGAVGIGYTATLTATTGGTAPYMWSVSGGSLPAGLNITDAANGIISGMPTRAGTYNVTIKVVDTGGKNATKALSITIQPVLTVPAAALPNGFVGSFYAVQIVANGPSPLVWTQLSGILPPGITLSTSGALTGTATQ